MDSRYHWILYAFIGAWGALLACSLLLVFDPSIWRSPTLGMAIELAVAFTFATRALAEFGVALYPRSNTDDLSMDVYAGAHRIATVPGSTLRQWRAQSSFRSPESARALGKHGAMLAAWALGACLLILVLLAVAIPEPPTQSISEMAPVVAIVGSITVAVLAAYDWPRLLEDRFMDELHKRYPERPAGILVLHAHSPESDAA